MEAAGSARICTLQNGNDLRARNLAGSGRLRPGTELVLGSGVLEPGVLMRRLALLTLVALAPVPRLAAQGPLPLAAGAEWTGAGRLVNRALLAAALKPVYAVRLMSDWPEMGNGSCRNGGEEVIGGELELDSGGDYVGRLRREATIRFCGTHGPATLTCSVTLRSEGPVQARGIVAPFEAGWTSPLLTLRWTATAEGTSVELEGDCNPTFTTALRRLYLGASHMIEFPLPVAGEGRRIERLEEGWIVEVQ